MICENKPKLWYDKVQAAIDSYKLQGALIIHVGQVKLTMWGMSCELHSNNESTNSQVSAHTLPI